MRPLLISVLVLEIALVIISGVVFMSPAPIWMPAVLISLSVLALCLTAPLVHRHTGTKGYPQLSPPYLSKPVSTYAVDLAASRAGAMTPKRRYQATRGTPPKAPLKPADLR